jgi:hypothetical protein
MLEYKLNCFRNHEINYLFRKKTVAISILFTLFNKCRIPQKLYWTNKNS